MKKQDQDTLGTIITHLIEAQDHTRIAVTRRRGGYSRAEAWKALDHQKAAHQAAIELARRIADRDRKARRKAK